jgi:hypothetical protein
MDRMHSFHGPVSKRVPEIPSRDPILFIHARPILANCIIWPRMGGRIADNGQDLTMLRCLRYLVPFVWLTGGWIGPGMVGQAVRVAAQSVSRSRGLVLHACIRLADGSQLARPDLTRRILWICSFNPRRANSTCLSAL